MTIQQLAQQAIDVQDACNLSGVARGFVRAIDELRAAGVSDVRNHPVSKLWASKLHSLAFTGLDDFGDAYIKCQALAGGGEVPA